MPLQRTTNGLLLRESFATLLNWVSDGTWASVADPAMVVFDPSPITALSPGSAGTQDFTGVREACPFQDDDGTWLLGYDGGDGADPWFPRYATSVDRGLTWTKQGAIGMGANNGVGGTWASAALGLFEKRVGVYYWHRVTANLVNSEPFGAGIPAGPYGGDIWSGPTRDGPWTFVRTYPAASGLFDGENLPGSTYYDGTRYQYFTQGNANSTDAAIVRFSFTTQTGAWTQASPIISGGLPDGRYAENPKMFYSAALNAYCILVNIVNPGVVADQNGLLVSASLTDWSAATLHRIQHVSPLDSTLAIGTIAHMTGPEGAPIVEADGNMPAFYDGFPTGGSPTAYAKGHHIQYVALEAAPHCVRYTASDTTPRRLRKTVNHTSIVAEWTAELRSIDGTNGALGFEFRRADDSNYYRLVLTAAGGLHLDKVVSGVATTLQSAASPTELGVAGLVHRLRLVANGTALDAWLNGEHQISTTDNTYAGGVGVAFTATDLDGDIRCFSLRTGQSVTVAPVQPGDVLTLRGAGGIPIQSITAGSTTATLSASHYPQYRIDRNGVDLTPGGGVWGGDVYDLSAPIGQYPFG